MKLANLVPGQFENQDKVTMLTFGECGTGKSTFLSLLSRIYAKWFVGADEERPINFVSAKSAASVTTKVKLVKTGNMTLIDTPGTNDPDKKRTDQQIQMELMNTIRSLLMTPNQGINTIVQCIMPDAGGRIKKSALDAMCIMLVSLTSL